MSLEELGLTPGHLMLGAVSACLTLVAVGLRMSGYTNRIVGLALLWTGVSGLGATLLWWLWPLSSGKAALLLGGLLGLWFVIRLLRRKDRARIGEVAAHLGNLCEELTRLYGQVGRSRKDTEAAIVPWKENVLEYLDANFGPEIATEFHALSTRRDSGQPYEHIQSSYEEHLRFLEKLRARVERGVARPKGAEEPSGVPPRRVRSFIDRLG